MTAIITPQAWYLKAKEIYPVPVEWVRAQYQEAGSGKLLKGSSPYVLGPLASNGSRPSLSLLPKHPSSQSLLSQCSSHGFLICFILGAVVIWFRNLGPDLNPGWVYLEMLNFIFIKIRFSDKKKKKVFTDTVACSSELQWKQQISYILSPGKALAQVPRPESTNTGIWEQETVDIPDTQRKILSSSALSYLLSFLWDRWYPWTNGSYLHLV